MTSRPRGTRLVQFRDVPNGSVVCDLEGFWGTVYGTGAYKALDRWDAPRIVLKPSDLVSLPFAKPLRRATFRGVRSPSDGKEQTSGRTGRDIFFAQYHN